MDPATIATATWTYLTRTLVSGTPATPTNRATQIAKAVWEYATRSVVPTANFTGTPLSGNSPLPVAFTDTSTNVPTSWLWEKSDGSGLVDFAGTPTSQNPTETFAKGTWTVKETATNAAGSDSETKAGYVIAGDPAPPADPGNTSPFGSVAGSPNPFVKSGGIG